MIRHVFFDFDGTIINSQKRMYNLFCELCPKCKMSYDEYWEIKRQKVLQPDFLKKYYEYSEDEINNFKKNWIEKIEEPKRISEDFVITGMDGVVKKLSENYSLVLVTHRQFKELVTQQLSDFGLIKYFDKVLVTEQKISKENLIRQNIENINEDDIVIGDTCEDVMLAKTLKVKSIAVTHGFLNEDVLMNYTPNFIVREVKDFDKCSFL